MQVSMQYFLGLIGVLILSVAPKSMGTKKKLKKEKKQQQQKVFPSWRCSLATELSAHHQKPATE